MVTKAEKVQGMDGLHGCDNEKGRERKKGVKKELNLQ